MTFPTVIHLFLPASSGVCAGKKAGGFEISEQNKG